MSPGASWVTIAIVTRGVFTVPPVPPPPPVSAGLPPVLEHAANAVAVSSAPSQRRRAYPGAIRQPSRLWA